MKHREHRNLIPFVENCPHCGAEPVLVITSLPAPSIVLRYRCSDKNCHTTHASEEAARKAWNRREVSWEAQYSARYILEDANPEKLADACGLPMGVITAALRNILPTK